MTYLHSILLGIIQGLTEFLPISSSAHLVLVPYLFGWNFPTEQIFPFDVLVQLGTLLAVIVYFWKDLWAVIKAFVLGLARRQPFADPDSRLGWYLILATIPAGLLGLLIKDQVEAAFHSPRITAVFLLVTAVLLFIGEEFGRKTRPFEGMNSLGALAMGIFQALSIFPGVSRSGSSITGGLLSGFTRPAAARFSFFMSIPVMLAAGLLSILDLRDIPNLAGFLPVVLAGVAAAAVVGYLSIRWLLAYLGRHSLFAFSIYCTLLGVLALVISYVR